MFNANLRLEPHTEKRLLVPILRVKTDSNFDLNAKLPSIVARQFVLNSDVDDTFLRLNRKIVWYRERFLENIACSWQCGSRSGIVDFTDYTLDPHAMEALKSPEFDVGFELDPGAKIPAESDFNLRVNDFSNINVTITNTSQESARLFIERLVRLRHAAEDTDTSQLFAWDGALTRQALPHLEQDTSTQLPMTLVFLAQGTYDLFIHVYDESDPTRSATHRQGLLVQ